MGLWIEVFAAHLQLLRASPFLLVLNAQLSPVSLIVGYSASRVLWQRRFYLTWVGILLAAALLHAVALAPAFETCYRDSECSGQFWIAGVVVAFLMQPMLAFIAYGAAPLVWLARRNRNSTT